MDISSDVIKRVAELSRLYVSPEDIARYQQEFLKIVHSFEALAKFKLPDHLQVESRSAIAVTKAQGQAESVSHLRQDTAHNSVVTQDLLSNAPDKEGLFIRVPAVLTQST